MSLYGAHEFKPTPPPAPQWDKILRVPKMEPRNGANKFLVFLSVAGLTLLFLAFVLTGCQHDPITYEPDTTFLVAADAGSPEFLVYINDGICRDMTGQVGLCARKLKSGEDIAFRTEPQAYAYRVHLVCSESVTGDQSFDIQQGQAWSYEIPYDKYKSARGFLCIGEVFPNDRPTTVSARFEVRFAVVDVHFVDRERIQVRQDGKGLVVVLGAHAAYGRVCVAAGSGDEESCENIHESPVVHVAEGKPEEVFAWSESENMRFNYYFGGQ